MSMTPIIGRVLTCTRCKQRWLVTELPVEYLDPDTYVCGECLERKGKKT